MKAAVERVTRQLLGEDFAGFLTTDRWSAYEWVDAGLRQLCWAHLTRDFQVFIDRGGRGGRIGREPMGERDRFFKRTPPNAGEHLGPVVQQHQVPIFRGKTGR